MNDALSVYLNLNVEKKMENEMLAARDGVVASVAVTKGAIVNSGDVLITLK